MTGPADDNRKLGKIFLKRPVPGQNKKTLVKPHYPIRNLARAIVFLAFIGQCVWVPFGEWGYDLGDGFDIGLWPNLHGPEKRVVVLRFGGSYPIENNDIVRCSSIHNVKKLAQKDPFLVVTDKKGQWFVINKESRKIYRFGNEKDMQEMADAVFPEYGSQLHAPGGTFRNPLLLSGLLTGFSFCFLILCLIFEKPKFRSLGTKEEEKEPKRRALSGEDDSN